MPSLALYRYRSSITSPAAGTTTSFRRLRFGTADTHLRRGQKSLDPRVFGVSQQICLTTLVPRESCTMQCSTGVRLLAVALALRPGLAISDEHADAIRSCSSLTGKHGEVLEAVQPHATDTANGCLWITSVGGRHVLNAKGEKEDSRKGGHLIASDELRMIPRSFGTITWLYDADQARALWREQGGGGHVDDDQDDEVENEGGGEEDDEDEDHEYELPLRDYYPRAMTKRWREEVEIDEKKRLVSLFIDQVLHVHDDGSRNGVSLKEHALNELLLRKFRPYADPLLRHKQHKTAYALSQRVARLRCCGRKSADEQQPSCSTVAIEFCMTGAIRSFDKDALVLWGHDQTKRVQMIIDDQCTLRGDRCGCSQKSDDSDRLWSVQSGLDRELGVIKYVPSRHHRTKSRKRLDVIAQHVKT